jgi:AcrR family transcriptional regulator
MAQATCENLDPRIRRTRQMLLEALDKLLEANSFDKISVHDITDAAAVNRATFYDHYTDKFGLLQCLVGSRFEELLVERGIAFEACASALRAIILAVCDYLMKVQGSDGRRPLEPHMESAIVAVVRRMILEGLEKHSQGERVAAPEIIAATISWAIYGAAKEWAQTPDRRPPEEIAELVAGLVGPMLQNLSHA